jgi:hypothetical protein
MSASFTRFFTAANTILLWAFFGAHQGNYFQYLGGIRPSYERIIGRGRLPTASTRMALLRIYWSTAL